MQNLPAGLPRWFGTAGDLGVLFPAEGLACDGGLDLPPGAEASPHVEQVAIDGSQHLIGFIQEAVAGVRRISKCR